MNKNVIIAIFLVAVIFFVIIVLFQGGQGKNSTALNLNPTLPAQSAQPTTPQSPQISPIPTTSFVSATGAKIKTAKGDIVVKLYPEDAPKTVTNFATLASTGYYNNLTFHRVEPGFVIQGGDPSGDGTGGVSIYGPTFEDELNANTPSYKEGYKEGVLAMANRGPSTNGSQFFIMLADNTSLPHAYTIFGKVVQGMDVVHAIQKGDKMTSVTLGLPEGLSLSPTPASSSATPKP